MTNQNSSTKSQSSKKTNIENKNIQSNSEEQPKNKSKFVRHVWWLDALLFIGGTILLGGLATLLGGKMFNFANYKMPPGIVPKIVFPIAWSIIYIAIGVSTFLMWRDKEIKSNDRKINLVIYFIHMFFNIMWPLLFFRLNLPIVSCIWLLFVVASACVVMYRYFVANLPAGIIFTIYTIWLIYAMYLNLGLVLINF
jgi:tryptophan-rich sensory protein